MNQPQNFDNQADTARDLWAETYYPLCTRFGLRIVPGGPDWYPGIPHEALAERLQAVGKWGDWCNWGGNGLTVGPVGVYPWDVENFLAGLENHD